MDARRTLTVLLSVKDLYAGGARYAACPFVPLRFS